MELEEEEKKDRTIFDLIGFDKTKMDPIVKKLKKLGLLLLIGWIGGIIIDVTLNTRIFQSVIPLIMILTIALKMYQKEKEKKE
jgi:uncharacterized membrane protein YfcA